MWTPVYVTVKSLVPDVGGIERSPVNSRDMTWDEVLISNGIFIASQTYCLKTPNLRSVLLPTDKVSSYIATFRRKHKEYIVKLVEKIPTRRPQAKSRGRRTRQQPEQNSSHSPAADDTVPLPSPRPGHSSSSADIPNNRPPGPSMTFFGKIEQELYPEGSLRATPERPQVNEDFSARPTPPDFDDTASQLSQDSQMDLEDIKTYAVARLQSTSNSVFHDVRREIRNLKLRSNYMRISRYIPLTLHLVSHMLPEN